MSKPAPIYTADNCTFAAPLTWGVSLFWREPTVSAHPNNSNDPNKWLEDLATALKPDGITLVSHTFANCDEARHTPHTPHTQHAQNAQHAQHAQPPRPKTSQFILKTLPHIAPVRIVQRLKGRLQYLIRGDTPKAFKRNFAIRSIGKATRATTSRYVETQLGHHQMADAQVQQRLQQYQIINADVDISRPSSTSHGKFGYVLHLVLVHEGRGHEVEHETLLRVKTTIEKAARIKGYALARAGVLTDHLHLLRGCPFDESPQSVALGYLNNLAYAHGMRPVYQYGAYVETIGEYTTGALRQPVGTNIAPPG